MLRPARTVLLTCTAAVLMTGVPGPADAGTATLVRYASPTGGNTDCSRATPCDLQTAVNGASPGGDVAIGPGVYGPLTDPITYGGSGTTVTIHGEAGQPRPLIISSASFGFNLQSASLSDVAIDFTGSHIGAVAVNGTLSHVAVVASSDDADACASLVAVIDSLCVATGLGGAGIAIESSSSATVAVRGVTAIGTAEDATGMIAAASGSAALDVAATNDIFHGGYADIDALSLSPTCSTTVTTRHSDAASPLAQGANAQVTSDATDITAAAKFVDPAHGNYREQPSSPTVNKGGAAAAHETDLAGRPRWVGAAPDIGAYELLQRPTAGRLKVASVKAQVATLVVRVNPQGLSTTAGFVARHGRAHVQGHRSVGSGHRPRTVHLTLRGLRRHHTYRVVVTAMNPGGRRRSHTATFTTH